MNVAVPREAAPNEARVALVPETVAKLAKDGVTVKVARGAGDRAAFPDELYSQAGASIADTPADLLSSADLVVTVGRPGEDVLAAVPKGAAILGLLAPLGDASYVKRLAEAGVTALSMDAIPRITRAQSMDALSSQSNIAGYKAVLLAALALPKFFPMLTTAAGTIPPAKVLILGAGVAGLQAIATARRLGAVVSAYDTRAVVKEQVQSLGATFLEIDLGVDAQTAGGYAKELTPEQIEKQRQFMVDAIGASDVVITTALVPGRPAPLLITEQAVAAMRPGSVIVDLAAEAGGNCALTKRDETVISPNGVQIIGQTNLPSTMPYHASQLYSRNVHALLGVLLKDGALNLDMNDEIARGTTIVLNGTITHQPSLDALGMGAAT
ncbi:MAG TPA: Re/Si-specific NAD(P)(+) transhydrogenase subunit alpha [Candidatus Baltobacteraceae bacterium]|jgi:NAD(P) transhydrogenase subunit alpha|nr:Re/Si-specific NAD(P)(+) transhydrogenase subunit alpha [Candidatus Baltobacteraceae bacterium]